MFVRVTSSTLPTTFPRTCQTAAQSNLAVSHYVSELMSCDTVCTLHVHLRVAEPLTGSRLETSYQQLAILDVLQQRHASCLTIRVAPKGSLPCKYSIARTMVAILLSGGGHSVSLHAAAIAGSSSQQVDGPTQGPLQSCGGGAGTPALASLLLPAAPCCCCCSVVPAAAELAGAPMGPWLCMC
jgi:hypothetical protein